MSTVVMNTVIMKTTSSDFKCGWPLGLLVDNDDATHKLMWGKMIEYDDPLKMK